MHTWIAASLSMVRVTLLDLVLLALVYTSLRSPCTTAAQEAAA